MRGRRFHGELESLRRSIEKRSANWNCVIAKSKKPKKALRRQSAFDALITRLMGRFVSANASEIDAEIIGSLQCIAQFMEVDSGVVIDVSEEKDAWSVVYEWCAPGVASRKERFQNIQRGTSPWVEDRVEADVAVAIGSKDELPELRLWSANVGNAPESRHCCTCRCAAVTG